MKKPRRLAIYTSEGKITRIEPFYGFTLRGKKHIIMSLGTKTVTTKTINFDFANHDDLSLSFKGTISYRPLSNPELAIQNIVKYGEEKLVKIFSDEILCALCAIIVKLDNDDNPSITNTQFISELVTEKIRHRLGDRFGFIVSFKII